MSVKISVRKTRMISEPDFGLLSSYASDTIYDNLDDRKLANIVDGLKLTVVVDNCFVLDEEAFKELKEKAIDYPEILNAKVDFSKYWVIVFWY